MKNIKEKIEKQNMKKNKIKKEKIHSDELFNNEYIEREEGKRFSDIDLTAGERLKIKLKKRYSNVRKGLKSDLYVHSKGEQGEKWVEYEQQLFAEKIIEIVKVITEEYDVFQTDSKAKLLKIQFDKYNKRFNRYEFLIKLNKKRNMSELVHLQDIFDEEINENNTYKFEVSVKPKMKKIYVSLGGGERTISLKQLERIKNTNKIFGGVDKNDKDTFIEMFGDNNPHTMIIGATGSGKTTYALGLIKQLQYINKNSSGNFFNGKKLLKKDLWMKKLDIELWDGVKGKDFKDIKNVRRCMDTKKIVARILKLQKYIEKIGNAESKLKPESRKIIIMDEFISNWAKIRKELDDKELEEVISSYNTILAAGRSAGVTMIILSQRLNESGDLAGLQLHNFQSVIVLRSNGNTKNYIKSNFGYFKDVELQRLKKGELYYVDHEGEERFLNWLMFDDKLLNRSNEELDEFDESEVGFDHGEDDEYDEDDVFSNYLGDLDQDFYYNEDDEEENEENETEEDEFE